MNNLIFKLIFSSPFFHWFLIQLFFPSSIAVRQSNEPGWLDGTLNGKSGLIPENYVEALK